MNKETMESLLEDYDGCKELMESRETTVIVERTETAHLCKHGELKLTLMMLELTTEFHMKI